MSSKSIKEMKDEMKAMGKTIPDTSNMNIEKAREVIEAAYKSAMSAPPADPEPEDGHEVEDSIKASEVMKMMAEMRAEMQKRDQTIDDLKKQVEAKAAAASPATGASLLLDPAVRLALRSIQEQPTNEKGLMRMQYVNDDDRLPAPVTFYTNKRNQKLFHVMIHGQPVANPLNLDVVRFRNLFWFRNPRTGRIDTRGEFVTESKSMAEWIRKSNKYGVEIFETVEEVVSMSENSEWADIRDRHLTALNNKSDSDIDRMAHQYGIAIGRGVDYYQIRKKIAEKLADAEVSTFVNSTQEKLRASQNSQAIIQQHLGAGMMPVLQP